MPFLAKRLRVLRAHPALGKLPAEALGALAQDSEIKVLGQGAMLWRRGDAASGLTLVVRGIIATQVRASGSARSILEVLGPNTSVDDASVLTGQPRPTDAVALAGFAEVCVTPAAPTLDAVRKCPAAGVAWTAAMGTHVAAIRRRILGHAATAEERMKFALVELAEQFGDELEDGGVLLPLHLTRRELASLVGTASETVSRVLSSWSRVGVLTEGSNGMVLRWERAASQY